MLRHFVRPSQDDWDVKLSCCEFAIDNAWNCTTGTALFFLNFGEHPRRVLSMLMLCASCLLLTLLWGGQGTV